MPAHSVAVFTGYRYSLSSIFSLKYFFASLKEPNENNPTSKKAPKIYEDKPFLQPEQPNTNQTFDQVTTEQKQYNQNNEQNTNKQDQNINKNDENYMNLQDQYMQNNYQEQKMKDQLLFSPEQKFEDEPQYNNINMQNNQKYELSPNKQNNNIIINQNIIQNRQNKEYLSHQNAQSKMQNFNKNITNYIPQKNIQNKQIGQNIQNIQKNNMQSNAKFIYNINTNSNILQNQFNHNSNQEFNTNNNLNKNYMNDKKSVNPVFKTLGQIIDYYGYLVLYTLAKGDNYIIGLENRSNMKIRLKLLLKGLKLKSTGKSSAIFYNHPKERIIFNAKLLPNYNLDKVTFEFQYI